MSEQRLALALVVVVVMIEGAFLFLAVQNHDISALKAAALFLLGTVTIGFAALFLLTMHVGEFPQLESHWGGFGGGMGGWRLSSSLVYLLGAVVFAGFFAFAGAPISGSSSGQTPTPTQTATAVPPAATHTATATASFTGTVTATATLSTQIATASPTQTPQCEAGATARAVRRTPPPSSGKGAKSRKSAAP